MRFQNVEPPAGQHEYRRGHPGDGEMKRRPKGSSCQAALEGRLSQRAAGDVLQHLDGVQTLGAESNHAVDSIKYSSSQSTPEDRLPAGKSLLLSENRCVVHSFLPSMPMPSS